MLDVHVRTLQRAADIVGGEEALARRLKVTPSHLALWLEGKEPPSTAIFLRAVDLVLEDDMKKLQLSGAAHPITTRPAGVRVQVLFRGEPIADSEEAIALHEANYPVVYYLPREDVDMARLVRSSHTTHCPHKGDAAYYSLADGPENCVWTYESPQQAVAEIRGLLAFYADNFEIRAG